MKVQVNGKDVTYQASGVSNWLTMTPDSYSAASTYRFRAEKGALKNIAANGYNGFGVQAGKLRIGITEKMETARGLDLVHLPGAKRGADGVEEQVRCGRRLEDHLRQRFGRLDAHI